jgi:hypothetical protein
VANRDWLLLLINMQLLWAAARSLSSKYKTPRRVLLFSFLTRVSGSRQLDPFPTPTSHSRHGPILSTMAKSCRRLVIVIILSILANQATFVVGKNPGLDQCGQRWRDAVNQNQAWALRLLYKGEVRGLKSGQHPPPLIRYSDCKSLCGSSHDLYNWATISDTVTTWILPLAGGLLLQAPFESNQRLSTIFVICRWLGSPIACLMAMFWNMKVTGRCALLLDMSVSIDQTGSSFKHSFSKSCKDFWEQLKVNFTLNPPALESPDPIRPQDLFGQFRDSLYILSVLNQFVFNEEAFENGDTVPIKRLIQYALFSSNTSLRRESTEAVISSRKTSQGGNAPVSSSASHLTVPHDPQRSGSTSTSQTLNDGHTELEKANAPLIQRREHLADAIRKSRKHGVVQVLVSMMWFLVALIISIYKAFGDIGDNTTAHDLAMGLLMSWLPVLISASLVDRNPTNSELVQRRLEKFLEEASNDLWGSSQANPPADFQDRQPTTQNGQRESTVLRPTHYLKFFNGQGRKAWHYGIAHTILTHIEDSTLRLTDSSLPMRERRLLTFYENGSMANDTSPMAQGLWRFDMIELWKALLAFAVVACSAGGAFAISYNEPTVGLGYRSGGYMIFVILNLTTFFLEMAGWSVEKPGIISIRRHRVRIALRLIITVIEVFNTAWLIYILIAQTFGIYNKCSCKASIWGSQGDYADFETGAAIYLERYDIRTYWYIGTVIGILPLFTIVYIVYQWCIQSFLWAEDFDAGMRGLRRVRRWKSIFHWNWVYHFLIKLPDRLVIKILGEKEYKLVEWSRK